nr:hypothetical protein [Pandoravirus massiliensis]
MNTLRPTVLPCSALQHVHTEEPKSISSLCVGALRRAQRRLQVGHQAHLALTPLCQGAGYAQEGARGRARRSDGAKRGRRHHGQQPDAAHDEACRKASAARRTPHLPISFCVHVAGVRAQRNTRNNDATSASEGNDGPVWGKKSGRGKVGARARVAVVCVVSLVCASCPAGSQWAIEGNASTQMRGRIDAGCFAISQKKRYLSAGASQAPDGCSFFSTPHSCARMCVWGSQRPGHARIACPYPAVAATSHDTSRKRDEAWSEKGQKKKSGHRGPAPSYSQGHYRAGTSGLFYFFFCPSFASRSRALVLGGACQRAAASVKNRPKECAPAPHRRTAAATDRQGHQKGKTEAHPTT